MITYGIFSWLPSGYNVILVCYSGANYPATEYLQFVGFLGYGRFLSFAGRERERELGGLRQLMAHRNPPLIRRTSADGRWQCAESRYVTFLRVSYILHVYIRRRKQNRASRLF